MKKIISTLIVISLLCLSSFSAFAELTEATVSLSSVTIDAVESGSADVTLQLSVTPDADGSMWSLQGTFELPNGITYKGFNLVDTAMTSAAELSTNVFGFYDNTAEQLGSAVTADGTVIADVVFTITDAAVAGEYEINLSGLEILDAETFDTPAVTPVAGKITVKAEEPAATVNTLEVVGEPAAVTSSTIDGEPTDYQIGSGIGITVKTDTAFTQMKWAITVAGERRFSETISLAGLPSTTGQFAVAATFINGVREENAFGIEEKAPVEFSNVGAIFTDGIADYFTNADDAALKEVK